MFSKILIFLCFASIAFAKTVVLQNVWNEPLTVSVSGKNNIDLLPNIPVPLELEEGWSGTISACVGACSGDVRSSAVLRLGATLDKYAVSLVNGFNIRIKVVPINGSNCQAAVCGANINRLCPVGSQVVNGWGQVVACQNNPLIFGKVCPRAIIAEGEEAVKTLTCNATAYKIVLGGN